MNADTGRGTAIMGNSDAFFHVLPYVVEAVQRARGWKSPAEPHRASDAIAIIGKLKGTQAALDVYGRLKQGAVPGYDKPNEGTLNEFGYTLLAENKLDDAIKVFQQNVQEYPQGWNCYDSLGEAYMKAGRQELAIQNYEKSVQMNPQNTNGVDMLKKLREGK